MTKAKIGVLISGRGSNLQSLIDAARAPDYPAEISIVISNRPNAAGLQRAQDAGVPVEVIDHKEFQSREDFDDALHEALTRANVDFVCLAGFMRRLTEDFVKSWRGRMLNIHPSLLPAFKGLNVHERMLDAGVKIAGCTVHFVSSDVDGGPVIGQAAVAVAPGDTAERLAARILEQEHKLYPACLKLIVENSARLSGGVVTFDATIKTDETLINPPA